LRYWNLQRLTNLIIEPHWEVPDFSPLVNLCALRLHFFVHPGLFAVYKRSAREERSQQVLRVLNSLPPDVPLSSLSISLFREHGFGEVESNLKELDWGVLDDGIALIRAVNLQKLETLSVFYCGAFYLPNRHQEGKDIFMKIKDNGVRYFI